MTEKDVVISVFRYCNTKMDHITDLFADAESVDPRISDSWKTDAVPSAVVMLEEMGKMINWLIERNSIVVPKAHTDDEVITILGSIV